jgi:hypothetical protein
MIRIAVSRSRESGFGGRHRELMGCDTIMTLTLAKPGCKLLRGGGLDRTRICDLLRVKQAL